MSRKGGYKIIDLKGLDFSSSMVIDGIHESIEDNYGKPLLFSGIVIDGVEKDDVFANAVVNGDGYDVSLYGQTLHISNLDVVSLNDFLTIYDDYAGGVNDAYELKNNDRIIVETSDDEEGPKYKYFLKKCDGVFISPGTESQFDIYNYDKSNNDANFNVSFAQNEKKVIIIVKDNMVFISTYNYES